MFRTLLDPAPFSSTLITPTSSSLLYPSHRTNPCASPQGLWIGRMAEQSPLTGYEPNALVEVSRTEHWLDLQIWRGHGHYTCCAGGD